MNMLNMQHGPGNIWIIHKCDSQFPIRVNHKSLNSASKSCKCVTQRCGVVFSFEGGNEALIYREIEVLELTQWLSWGLVQAGGRA